MGFADYLAHDLELLNDPELEDDNDDEIRRELEYFRVRRSEKRNLKKARATAEEAARQLDRDSAMEVEVGQTGWEPAAAAGAPAEENGRWAGETSFVDETRFVETGLQLSPPPAAAQAVEHAPHPASSSRLSTLAPDVSITSRSLPDVPASDVPAAPAVAPERPRHPLATVVTASSSPPRSSPVVEDVRRRSDSTLVKLTKQGVPGKIMSKSVARHVEDEGEVRSVERCPVDDARDRPSPTYVRPSHLHSAGGHASGLLPRGVSDKTLALFVETHVPSLARIVGPHKPGTSSSAAATPPRTAAAPSSPSSSSFASFVTPAQAGPSTLAQFEDLTNVTSPGDSVLAASPTQASPPPTTKGPGAGDGKTARLSKDKMRMLARQQAARIEPVVQRKIPGRKLKSTSDLSATSTKRQRKEPPAKEPNLQPFVEYAAKLNKELADDLEKSKRLRQSPVVLDGSQDEPAPTDHDLARLRLREVLRGVRAFIVWSAPGLVNEIQRNVMLKMSALGVEILTTHTAPQITHVVVSPPHKATPAEVQKGVLVKFGVKLEDLKKDARAHMCFVKEEWIDDCCERVARVDEDKYHVFPIHRRMYDKARARATHSRTTDLPELELASPTSTNPAAERAASALDKCKGRADAAPALKSVNDHMLDRFIQETQLGNLNGDGYDSSGSTDDEVATQAVADPAAERALLKQLRAERRAELKQQGGTWACMRKAPLDGEERPSFSNNELIVKAFTELGDIYEAQEGRGSFHAGSYRTVVARIRSYPKEITSGDYAQRMIRGIGDKQAAKIDEIVKKGTTSRLLFEKQTPRNVALTAFAKIFGVGITGANALYDMGARSLDELRADPSRFKLSTGSRVGLELYDDLLERIPRDEVEQIGAVIKAAVRRLAPGDDAYHVDVLGSFCRGAPTCGDVDILLSRDTADGQTHAGMFDRLVEALHATGFLTHDLSISCEGNALEMTYHGTCRLSPAHKHRRIDILTVPYEQRGGAQLYFSSSSYFNRSMRKLAQTRGWRLNQRGLFERATKGVQHGAKNLEPIAARTEQEIFDKLGVTWRPPTERNC